MTQSWPPVPETWSAYPHRIAPSNPVGEPKITKKAIFGRCSVWSESPKWNLSPAKTSQVTRPRKIIRWERLKLCGCSGRRA